MSFLQTYYTSCERGLRGGKGFQFNAVSAGLDPALLPQIERLGLYLPPLSQPTHPSPAEIEAFPIALLYQRLANDCLVLAQARYEGLDYSGRFGNYFTHALVSTDPHRDITAQGFLPIELWRSKGWQHQPAPLTELPPLSQLPAGDAINPENVQQFLLEEEERLHRLPYFLTAVAQALQSGRRIVLVDDNEHIACWIAAASYALPAPLALRLTFNTYVKNPYQTDFLLVGTTPDSDFRFAPHELAHQFFVFDFVGRRFSPLNEVSGFARNAALFYQQGAVERLAEFGRFCARVAPDLPPAELDTALACYTLLLGLEPRWLERRAVLRWAARRLADFNPGEAQTLLTGVLIEPGMSIEVIDACTDFYLAARDLSTHAGIETAYLSVLVKEVGAPEHLHLLQHILTRLPPLDAEGQRAAQPLRKHWLTRLRHTEDALHLAALLALGERCGFLNVADEALATISKNHIAPLLPAAPIQRSVLDLAATPAFHSIINGVGAFLASKVKNAQLFNQLAGLLSQPVIASALGEYARETQQAPLYARVLAAAQSPDYSLPAFQHYLDELRRWHGPAIPTAAVEEGFAALWPGLSPTAAESLQLLELLRAHAIADSTIPQHIARAHAVVGPAQLAQFTREQVALIEALCHESCYMQLDEERRRDVYIYHCAIMLTEHLQRRTADEATLAATLNLLQQHGVHLMPPVRTRLYQLVAQCLPYERAADTQFEFLLRGCDEFRPEFIEAYAAAVVGGRSRPAPAHYYVLARFFIERVLPAVQQTAPPPAAQSDSAALRRALRRWRARDWNEIGQCLKDDRRTFHWWRKWRQAGRRSLVAGIPVLRIFRRWL